MKQIKKYLLRPLKYLGLGIFSFVAFYFLFAFLLSRWSTKVPVQNCTTPQHLYLTSNGIHLDIVVPVEWLDSQQIVDFQTPKWAKYLSFGWGDRGFYLETPTWESLKFSTVVQALFTKSPTVMHVSPYQRKLEKWSKVELCPSQIQAILNHINLAFLYNEIQQSIEIKGAGYGLYDRFYDAKGHYHCWYTCNSWVNEALKKAQVKTAVWAPFDWSILYHFQP